MIHAYNSSTQERQENSEFEATLGYTVRPCLKITIKKPKKKKKKKKRNSNNPSPTNSLKNVKKA
jgi:hypothetical protein